MAIALGARWRDDPAAQGGPARAAHGARALRSHDETHPPRGPRRCVAFSKARSLAHRTTRPSPEYLPRRLRRSIAGAINPREEAKLLHELGHDADQLRKGVAPTPDGTGGKNQKAISVAEAGRFVRQPRLCPRTRNARFLSSPPCRAFSAHADARLHEGAHADAEEDRRFQ